MSFLRRWLQGEPEEEEPLPVVRRATPSAPSPAPEAAAAGPVVGLSEWGPGLRVEGTLTGRGRVRIHGTFRGRIHLQGELLIGPKGMVEAEVCEADTVVVEGLLKGPVRAKTVVLKRTGRLYGDVVTMNLEAEAGGFLHGQVRTEEVVMFPWDKPHEEAEQAHPREAREESGP